MKTIIIYTLLLIPISSLIGQNFDSLWVRGSTEPVNYVDCHTNLKNNEIYDVSNNYTINDCYTFLSKQNTEFWLRLNLDSITTEVSQIQDRVIFIDLIYPANYTNLDKELKFKNLIYLSTYNGNTGFFDFFTSL